MSKWNDLGWWYNERASVSLLAGAAGRAGAITLEEYPTDRRNLKSRPANGSEVRQDLYLRVGKSEFVGEAKQLWMRLPKDHKRMHEEVIQWIDAAVTDANSKASFGASRIGVLFVVPYLNVCSVKETNEAIQTWRETIQRFRRCAIAWVLPLQARRFPLSTRMGAQWKREIYPGCAIFMVRTRDWK